MQEHQYLTKQLKYTRGYCLFLAVTGLAMLWLNLLDMPTLSDDMIYRFMWNTDETAPVQTIGSLADLLHSQWNHYMTTNGRMVVHLLAQAFLVFCPAWVLHTLNALLFVVLVHLCVRWVTAPPSSAAPSSGARHQLRTAVIITFLLFVVFQGFGSAFLWGLGAFNYLWVLVAVMLLLHCLRSHAHQPLKGWRLLLLSFFALLAGWSHEALSLPLSVAFAAWLLAHSRLSRLSPLTSHLTPPTSHFTPPTSHLPPLTSRLTPLIFCFMLGTALCLLSPGIWSRSTEGITLQARLLSGVINCVSNIRVLWLLVLTLAVLWWKRRPVVSRHLLEHAYGYVALVVAFGIVLLCGTNLVRVAFFVDFIAMLLWLQLLHGFLTDVWSRRITLVGCVLLVLSFIPACMVRQENRDHWLMAERQMEEPGRELIAVQLPPKGESVVMDYFRHHYVNSSFEFGFYSVYMGFDANDINSRCAARLYGKDRMLFLPDDVVSRIQTDTAAYRHYELDRSGALFVWRLDHDRPVHTVRFVLNDEDLSQLNFLQRLLAYDGDTYELDDFHFEVITVCGRPYLVFTRPTTNIARRIRDVEIE